MDTDRNLLLGVLALQSDLIDCRRFVDACVLWATRKDEPLLDLLIERGWIDKSDKIHLEYFLKRTLERHGGDARASLAAMPDGVKRSLAAIDDPEIHQSLAGLRPHVGAEVDGTVLYSPRAEERYQLAQLHATGGIGRVWLAHDETLDRKVALKELRPELSADGELRARFLQEARITGQLAHPGIVPVYELGERPRDQEPFYTMRFVSGRTLATAARDFHKSRKAGQATTSDLLPLLNAFVTVCRTIAYAHSQGIVHRDLKGQNVVLGDFGEVVVLDWGLAKRLTSGDDRKPTDGFEPADPRLTLQGQVVGTPAYMAPEQAAGRHDQIDHLTDVYGLGAMLYEILTGTAPYTGSDTQEVLRKIQQEDIEPPLQTWPELPLPLNAACMRALAKRASERFPSAEDLGRVVEQWQEVERQRAQVALATSEAIYHSLVETIPMNVWRKDTEGRFMFANTGFCKATGRTLEELVGKTDFDVFPRESAEKYRRDDLHVMTTGETIDSVEEHQTAEGEKLLVRVVKVPIRDPQGHCVGTQGIFWDITDRKRVEEQLARCNDELLQLRRQVSDRTD